MKIQDELWTDLATACENYLDAEHGSLSEQMARRALADAIDAAR
jgi:hypothetical protein